MPSKVIAVVSVMHTGTYFLLDILWRHPATSACAPLIYLPNEWPALREKQIACTASLRMSPGGDASYDPGLLSDFANAVVEVLPEAHPVLRIHVRKPALTNDNPGDKVHYFNMYSQAILTVAKVVTPVRDPLAMLLSYHARGIGLNGRIVDFEYMTRLLTPVAFFLPVDLPWNVSQRLKKLETLLHFVGLQVSPHVEEVAQHWIPRGTRGRYEMKDWYDNGDIAKIKKVIPKEVSYLQKRETHLRPFLEKLGYSNLLWWS